MNKDQINGKIKEFSGAVKEITGKAIRNDELENKGFKEKILGKAQCNIGKLKEYFKK